MTETIIYDDDMYGRLILETDGTTIAGKVASHTIDESAPLSEQVTLYPSISSLPQFHSMESMFI